jgi:peroxiredoxin
MRNILVIILALTCWFNLGRTLQAQQIKDLKDAETNGPGVSPAIAALNDLVGRINEKIGQQKTNETDLAGPLKEFDTLFEKYKDAPERDRAQILNMKMQLYLLVLNQPEKALDVLKQIQRDIPSSQVGGNTEEAIRVLERKIQTQRVQRALIPGAKFPTFDETDIAGKPLSLEKYKGKVVLVDFWATWCVPCVIDMPHVIKTYEQRHQRGFEVIGISLDVDQAKLQSFIKDKNMPWQQYCDGKYWDTKLVLKYGVEAVPYNYLLDRKGNIVAVNLHGEQLEQAVAMETMPAFQRTLTSGTRAVDDVIRRAPYSTLAVVFVLGLFAGAVIMRRRMVRDAAAKK